MSEVKEFMILEEIYQAGEDWRRIDKSHKREDIIKINQEDYNLYLLKEGDTFQLWRNKK